MRSLLIALFLVLPAGLAGALPGAEQEEIVGEHTWYEPATQQACSSYDPLLGAVTTTLTSRLWHSEANGLTTYTLHLDAVSEDAAACPAIDFQFTSPLAWPAGDAFGWGPIQSACGASGIMLVWTNAHDRDIALILDAPPAACNLPFEAAADVYMRSQAAVSGYQACTPVVVIGCTGFRQGSQQVGCAEPDDSFRVSAFGFPLVTAGHRCERWTGRDYAYAGDGLGIVRLESEGGACMLRVSDPFFGFVAEKFACPGVVGDVIDQQDWAHILP